MKFRILCQFFLNGTTHPVKTRISGGGVGRNIAENLLKLGAEPQLISAIGNDSNGQFLSKLFPEECKRALLVVGGQSTASYSAIFDQNGECRIGLGDMSIHEQISADWILKHKRLLEETPLIIFDGNISIPTMESMLILAKKLNKPVFFEPTDIRKAKKPLLTKTQRLQFSTPNLNELFAMAEVLNDDMRVYQQNKLKKDNKDSFINESLSLIPIVLQSVDHLFITLGKNGLIVARRANAKTPFFDRNRGYIETKGDKIESRLYPVKVLNDAVNVSGAGDCFASGLIYSMLKGYPEDVCISIGLEAAKFAIHSESAVPNRLFGEQHSCWRNEAKYILL